MSFLQIATHGPFSFDTKRHQIQFPLGELTVRLPRTLAVFMRPRPLLLRRGRGKERGRKKGGLGNPPLFVSHLPLPLQLGTLYPTVKEGKE